MPDQAEQTQAQPAAATAEVNEFESLLNKEFKPKTAEAKSAVKLAVQTLAEQALAATTLVSDNAIKTIEAIIAEIDRKLSEQINLILHHDDFKNLEGSWRGLHYLVNNTETGENLKIRVMNISKKDAARTLKKFKGTAWDQSPLFKKLYGWCARIRGAESGGMVEGLPVHSFPTDDGGVDMKCPTEIGITDRREKELADCGFMPLSHWKNTDYAVFVGAQSLQKPQAYDDPAATANANLAARLPYLFATYRFAHYLKCMVRDKIGGFKERADMEQWLNTWIKQYCVDS